VVVLGEAVGFVADVLEEAERIGVPAESARLRFTGDEDLLVLLCEGDDEWAGMMDIEHPQGFDDRA